MNGKDYIDNLPYTQSTVVNAAEIKGFNAILNTFKKGDQAWLIISNMGQPDAVRKVAVKDKGRTYVVLVTTEEPAGIKEIVITSSSSWLNSAIFTSHEEAEKYLRILKRVYNSDTNWQRCVSQRWAIHDSHEVF
jgi:hypothetical protein